MVSVRLSDWAKCSSHAQISLEIRGSVNGHGNVNAKEKKKSIADLSTSRSSCKIQMPARPHFWPTPAAKFGAKNPSMGWSQMQTPEAGLVQCSAVQRSLFNMR